MRNTVHVANLIFVSLLTSGSISLPAWATGPAPEIWYVSNADAPDLVTMFVHPELWSRARVHINVFQFSPQQAAVPNVSGLNTVDDLARVDAFRLLGSWGIGIAIEAGAIKPWDCTGERAAGIALEYINNVRRAGGKVKALALDEPLHSGIALCTNTMQQVALKTSTYIKQVKSKASGTEIGDIEPYPGYSASQMIEFVTALEKNGAKPDFFHVDISIALLKLRPNVHLAADLQAMQDFFRKQGIPFGVIIWSGGYGAEPSDRAYYDRSMALARQVHEAIGTPDRLDFESWVTRSSQTCSEGQPDCGAPNFRCTPSDPPYCGKRSVPLNLPDNDPTQFTQTRLVLDVLKLFGKN
jgi:hypothetical protein